MEKIQFYRAAIDCAVFIRNFMYSENHFFRSLDFALQPFIEEVSESIISFIPEPKDIDDSKDGD